MTPEEQAAAAKAAEEAAAAAKATAEKQQQDNEANKFRRLHEQAQARALELEAKLKELERKDLDELTRTRAELEDAQKAKAELEPLRDEHGRFKAAMDSAYEAAIKALPEDKQQGIRDLTQSLPLDRRLSAVQSAISLLGVTAPTLAGTRTQPGGSAPPAPGAPEPPKPLDVKEVQRMSWADAAKANANPTVVTGPMAAISKEMADLRKQVEQLVGKK